MKATVEKLDNHQVLLEVEVEPPKVEKALDQAYRHLSKQVTIPGFRKGKVPRFVLEQFVGKEPLYNEAAEILIPDAYEKAVVEHRLSPINQPEIEIMKVKEGEPLVFKARVEVKPEPKLGTYLGLELERPEIKVTEEDIDKFIKSLQERNAELKVIEDEPAAAEDTVMINFYGEVDGESYPGMQGANYQLELGSGTFIPGFEEQLIGSEINEERLIKVTFPENYHVKDIAGKEAVFQVKVLGIKRKELAPLDDDFAKDVSECETLAELREDVRRRLEDRQQQEIESFVRKSAVEKAVATAEVDIPKVMVERRLDYRINELERNFQAQGLTLEQFLENTNKTMDELRRELQPRAEKDVKTELVLEAIAKAENIEAGQDEIDSEVEKLAGILHQSRDEVRKRLGDLSFLKYDIINKKVIDLLVEKSIIVPVKEKVQVEAEAEVEAVGSTGDEE